MQLGTIDDEHLAARSLAVTIAVSATLAVYLLFAVMAGSHTHNRVGLGGTPLFYDFSAFYQAGLLADDGRAAAAYDDTMMIASEKAAFPGATVRLPWNYPPTFQLLLMPLAALPYVAAWLIWSCTLYGVYALMARQLVAAGQRWLMLLAPGAAVNLFFGQNGLLSIVLMGGGVLILNRRPLMGGVLLGMMAYKPQLAILLPLVLISGHAWRALAAAAISQAALASLSAAVLGFAPWAGFVQKLVHPQGVFSSSSSDWRAIPSIMIFAKTVGLGPGLSSICHWTVAAMAGVGAAWAWRKTDDTLTRAAFLAAATLLVTPYLRDYDLVLLVLPISVLLSHGRRGPVVNATILVAWMLPAVLMFTPSRIQYGALVSAAVMGLLLSRVGPEPGPAQGVS